MSNFTPKKIIDISLALKEGMIIYPDNPPLTIEDASGPTSSRSILTIGTHTGTHIDAPRHVFKDGKGIDKIPLARYVGTCRVLDLTKAKGAITISDLEKFRIKKGERILAKTHNSKRGFKTFYDDYVCLDGDAADYLVKKEIVLFGIDSLSVKKRGSTDHRAHLSLLKKDIVIFEGLDLSKAPAGSYIFVGLPLKLGDIDGAPARAILIL